MTDNRPADRAIEITVIVCCFNAERTIAATLRTLQNQSRSPDKILVIDDGSTDRSPEIVVRIAADDPRIRLIRNEINRGTAFTRQRGLDEARTEAVMFFDADDLARDRLVEVQERVLLSDEMILGVGCHAHYFAEDETRPLGIQRVGPKDRDEAFARYSLNKMTFMPPVTLFRRRDALAVGGYRQWIMPNAQGVRYEDFAEDLDLWCRMSDAGAEGRYFVTVPEPLYSYRKPAGSLSTRNLELMQLKMRWIRDCLRQRRNGLAERTLAEFIYSRGFLDRLNDWRQDRAAGFYKQAGFSWAARDYVRLGLFLALTALASPKLIRQKIRTQAVQR